MTASASGEFRYVFLAHDQPQVLAGFFMEALRLEPWFRCRLKVKDAAKPEEFTRRTGLMPVFGGRVMELEITVPREPSWALLRLINGLLARQVRNVRFCGN